MVRRYEQWFYAHDGWNSWTSQDGTTGLVHIGIVAATIADPEGVEAWLARTKGWARGDYRLESRGVSADGCCDVLRAVHRLDGAGAQPGGGRSIEL